MSNATMTLEAFLRHAGRTAEALPKPLKGAKALAAVRKYGTALRFVHAQTAEICMAAVRKSGWILQDVREQTPELCMAAVRQEPRAIQFVDSRVFAPETNDEPKATS